MNPVPKPIEVADGRQSQGDRETGMLVTMQLPKGIFTDLKY
jgi:hypothetical protein